MQAIELLHNRVSSPVLTAPAPNKEQLEAMYQAAARVPDHAGLRPWRLLVLEGDELAKLGQVFLAENLKNNANLSLEQQKKISAKPQRAPMLMVVVAHITEHSKVPEVEQLITAGCAAYALELAAFAQGIGAMWRSGSMMFNEQVNISLNLAENEKIVGFLYLGTPKKLKPVLPVVSNKFVSNGKVSIL